MTSTEDQFDAAVNKVSLFDRTAIGRIEVTGKDAIDLFHRLSTQNLLQRNIGEVVGSVFTTDKGRIVDYVHILFREDSLLLLISPANEQAFKNWIDKFTIMENINLKVVTSSTGMISLMGPKAIEFAEQVLGLSMQVNRCVDTRIRDNAITIVCREEFQTQFVDLIFDLNAKDNIQTMLAAGGAEFGILEMKEPAFEIFRISRGVPTFGHELSGSFNPYEVNLAHAISFTKGCYLGQEVIARLDTYQKIQSETYGLVFDAALSPAEGSTVYKDGAEAGVLTSVSAEILRGKRIALGVLKKKVIAADDNISVVSSGQTFYGIVQRVPFAA